MLYSLVVLLLSILLCSCAISNIVSPLLMLCPVVAIAIVALRRLTVAAVLLLPSLLILLPLQIACVSLHCRCYYIALRCPVPVVVFCSYSTVAAFDSVTPVAVPVSAHAASSLPTLHHWNFSLYLLFYCVSCHLDSPIRGLCILAQHFHPAPAVLI
jgi:hypothetical protein